MARFQDIYFSRQALFSVGRDETTGNYYLSIPVSNRMVDYEEYYLLSNEQFTRFEADRAEAEKFADECRKRRHDDLLILKPGSDRGEPRQPRS